VIGVGVAAVGSTMQESVTVYVVERDAEVRQCLAWMIDGAGLGVRGFAEPSEFFTAYRDDSVSCVVLRMNGADPLELQAHLARRGASLPIIVVKQIERSRGRDELLDCIRRAIDVDRRYRETQRDYGLVAKLFSRLTPRECDVMRLVVEGKANKVIAAELGISQRTVEIHRGRVMRKTNAPSIADLVRREQIWRRGRESPRGQPSVFFISD